MYKIYVKKVNKTNIFIIKRYMGKNLTHLVISRVACKWYLEGKLRCEQELGKTWEEWYKESIILYDTYCRKSLEQQTEKNFKLISFFDSDINDYGKMLDNEIILKVDDIDDINDVLSRYIRENYPSGPILLSRIDRDDC